MKIGYPCMNRSIGCTSANTFRLRNYTPGRLVRAVEQNLGCLEKILSFNAGNGILFFRVTSDLVPFASHEVCRYAWEKRFRLRFLGIGRYIKRKKMRVSMHPDQFVVLNSEDRKVVGNSVRELVYHARVLDLMGLDASAKIQIHLGGVYGDRRSAMDRFVRAYRTLGRAVRKRLVIENDDRNYTVSDCLDVWKRTGVPVLLDVFHHSINPDGLSLKKALKECAGTWRRKDGTPMVDYSSQLRGARPGSHAKSLDRDDFLSLIKTSRGTDIDIMLEIKDKESSAVRAVRLLKDERRFVSS